MNCYRITYPATGSHGERQASLDAPDLRTALIVADINLHNGCAEIHDGAQCVARLKKRGRSQATFWEVG